MFKIKLIGIGQLDKYILFPFIGGIFKIIFYLTFENINNFDLSSEFIENPFILSIASSLGMSLSFFLLLIYKHKIKSIDIKKDFNFKKKSSQNSSNIIELEYNNQYEEISYDKYKYIFITSIIDFITTILLFKYYHNIRFKINVWIFDVFFLCIFSNLIFKTKIYAHHYISMILIILIGISLDIMLNKYSDFKENLLPNLIKFFCEIFYSLGIVINKYTMDVKFCSIFEICFFQGFIGFILYLILLLISKYIIPDNIIEIKFDFNLKDFFLFLAIMIIQFIYNLCIFATIRNFTACHFVIIIVIGEMAHYVLELFKIYPDISISIMVIVGLIIIFFMILVFNEVFELKCFGWQKNTKKNISFRAKKDISNDDGTEDILYSEENDSFIESERQTITSEFYKDDNHSIRQTQN